MKEGEAEMVRGNERGKEDCGGKMGRVREGLMVRERVREKDDGGH